MRVGTLKVGDRVRIEKIPPNLTDSAGIDTPRLFKRSLGKTLRVAGISEQGRLELEVTKSDTIWIEPQFVSRLKSRLSQLCSFCAQVHLTPAYLSQNRSWTSTVAEAGLNGLE